MTQDQRKAFEELRKHRQNADSVFQSPAFRGIKSTIADMYVGKAHFIYELLQNADDALATNVWFDIFPDTLVFRHNGKRAFNITMSPNDESGDVNAITSIGNSNKDTNSIGKFGIGFKAVYLYTEEPVVYTRDFSFRIVQWFVPELVETIPATISSFVEKGQTVFVFPFKASCLEEAPSVIADKLFNLKRPMLFLRTLRNIRIVRQGQCCEYSLRSESVSNSGPTMFEKVVCKADGQASYGESFLKATRTLDGSLSCSVAFAMSDDWTKPIPCPSPVHCFFPTHENPNLKFLVHAPFLVTNNRGNVQDNKHNAGLISALGELAANALVFLRDWGIKRDVPIIDDSVFDILPTVQSDYYVSNSSRPGYSWLTPNQPTMFTPIFEAIRNCMKNRGMLYSVETEPLPNRYVAAKDAFWAESTDLPKLFDNSLLAELTENQNAKWVFTLSGRPVASGDPLRDYKDELTTDWFSFMGRYGDHSLLDRITPDFLRRRPRDWCEKLYLYIQRHEKAHLDDISSRSIFLCNDGSFHPATIRDPAGNPQASLFLPAENITFSNVHILSPDLLKVPNLSEFFRETLRLKEPSVRDEVFNVILPKYETGKPIERPMDDMKLIFRAWKEGNDRDRKDIETALAKVPCFLSDDAKYVRHANELYFPTSDLKRWFADQPNVHYLAETQYRDGLGEDQFHFFRSFAESIGVASRPRKEAREMEGEEVGSMADDYKTFPPSAERSYFGRHWILGSIEGLDQVLERIHSHHDRNLSILLWTTLAHFVEDNSVQSLAEIFYGRYKWSYYGVHWKEFSSPLLARLRESPWLVTDDGNWIAPGEANVGMLSAYDLHHSASRILIEGLGIAERPSLTPEQEDKIRKYDELQERLSSNQLTTLDDVVRFLQGENTSPVPQPITPWSPVSFADMYDWWSSHATEGTATYNKSLYGFPELRSLGADSKKSVWMELLILGACHTLGGFQLEAHRGFIQWMRSNRFWGIVCADPVSPENWIRFLDYYLKTSETSPAFSYWMGLFPRIYQFSCFWKQYRDVFLWWNDPRKKPQSVQDLSAFQTNPLLQQTGITAPGLQKALGTTGIHFVFREMVRRGAIKNPALHPFCFVPYQGLSERLGLPQDSQLIHSSIVNEIGEEKSSFGGAFDVAITSYLDR